MCDRTDPYPSSPSARVLCAALPDATPYTVRRSSRARRVSLRVLPGKGLEVVLPEWADNSFVPEMLERHSNWIRKALGRMRDESSRTPEALPSLLVLRGGSEEWHIVADGEGRSRQGNGAEDAESSERADGRSSGLTPPEPLRRTLVLPREDLRDSLYRLRELLREEARRYLGRKLAQLSGEHGLTCGKLSVRFQKSRWGSCSAKGDISLNAGLLFLPEPLSSYIIRHELCHTRHMNHSAAFWKLLFSLDSDAMTKDRAMRRAWRYIPLWLYSL